MADFTPFDAAAEILMPRSLASATSSGSTVIEILVDAISLVPIETR